MRFLARLMIWCARDCYDTYMRITLPLDMNVSEQATRLARARGKPFEEIIDEALRLGLERMQQPAQAKPYRFEPHDMGLRPQINLSKIAEVIAHAEGENAR